jgi:hypothetical protein
MSYENDYNPADPNDIENEVNLHNNALADALKTDRGLNFVYRKFISQKTGKPKNKRISVYTTSGVGNRIRDAETGEYYPNRVGSKDEDLFFKVILATGECKSANGSSTLFYISPQHYMNHLNSEVNQDVIEKWEQKRNNRLAEMKQSKNN